MLLKDRSVTLAELSSGGVELMTWQNSVHRADTQLSTDSRKKYLNNSRLAHGTSQQQQVGNTADGLSFNRYQTDASAKQRCVTQTTRGQGHNILTSRELTWCYACSWDERRFNIEFYSADSHFCRSAYVTWSRVELWSTHVSARLSNFCCRTHFVRRDMRVERSSDVTSCFQKWRQCLLKKCANGPFYITPSHQVTEISI
jgi:hypothetical protein